MENQRDDDYDLDEMFSPKALRVAEHDTQPAKDSELDITDHRDDYFQRNASGISGIEL